MNRPLPSRALACVGPLLRVFRVEPTDVLRDDG